MPKTKPNVFEGQNITPSEFFSTHWQRSPYLFRNTAIDLSCLPDMEQLFALATQEDVQSRIVYSEDHIRYQAIYDEPEAWDELIDYQPTLLVSDVEKWYPTARCLMHWFPFIKNWRFDDLMMSFAPKGASVGAHTDHYDVFLLQVKGSRIWSYDDAPLSSTYKPVADSELAVVADWQGQHSTELKAGDMLYLPPGIAHHGISSSDDCLTCSVGLRAPSDAELLSDVTELLTQELSSQDRFQDHVQTSEVDASIGQHEIQYLRKHLTQMCQMEDAVLAELFGQAVTRYRIFDDFDIEADKPSNPPNHQWQKSSFAVFAYHVNSDDCAKLFVNGDVYSTSPYAATLICNHNTFSINLIEQHSNQPDLDKQVFQDLIERKFIIESN